MTDWIYGGRLAWLHTDDQCQSCVVVGETPKRYRVRAAAGAALRLPMRGNGVRTILSSGTALVLKYAISFRPELSR